MKYHCYCECVYDNTDQLIFVRKTENKKRVQQLRCPGHKDSTFGNIAFKTTQCEECGETFRFENNVHNVTKCDNCANKKQRASVRKYRKKKREEARALKLKAGPKKRTMAFKDTKEPIRVMSVVQAKNRGVNCIPLDNLFRVHAGGML